MTIRNRFRGTAPVSTWIGGSATAITLVQRGTITIGGASTSNTATLATGVDPTRTRLVALGNSSTEDGTTSMSSTGVRIVLTNATTVTASRLNGTGTVIVSFEVIEYKPGVLRSVQRGTVTATAAVSGTDTLPIPIGNLSRATVDLLGWDYNVALVMDSILGRVTLTNATTVTLTRAGTSGNLTAGYQVVEWT